MMRCRRENVQLTTIPTARMKYAMAGCDARAAIDLASFVCSAVERMLTLPGIISDIEHLTFEKYRPPVNASGSRRRRRRCNLMPARRAFKYRRSITLLHGEAISCRFHMSQRA